jgi:hypothetical protein
MKTVLFAITVVTLTTITYAENLDPTAQSRVWECEGKIAVTAAPEFNFIFEDNSLVEDGFCVRYDGKMKNTVGVKNGKRHGAELVYREDGSLLFEFTEYRNGVLDGYSRVYNSDGTLRVETRYNNGIKQERIVY